MIRQLIHLVILPSEKVLLQSRVVVAFELDVSVAFIFGCNFVVHADVIAAYQRLGFRISGEQISQKFIEGVFSFHGIDVEVSYWVNEFLGDLRAGFLSPELLETKQIPVVD